jgi:hypothetical protein
VPDPFTGTPTCRSQPVNCDDGNACTVDDCDPVTGGCLHALVPVAEVASLQFTDPTTLNWPAVAGANFYNTYRGTIPLHGLGSRPPAGPLYDQTCFEAGDSHGDGLLVSVDSAVPPLGTAFYYEVTEMATCGEGPIGTDSNTSIIPNTSPCLVP